MSVTDGNKDGVANGTQAPSTAQTQADQNEDVQATGRQDAPYGDEMGSKDGTDAAKREKLKKRIKTLKSGPPGGFDKKPLPNAPQGYTVRFVFHSATNLPIGDVSTGSSDAYLTATLKGSNPKRHKEDPDLTHRTKTIRNATDVTWNDEWVVANVPPTGFSLKCRLYDEDSPDSDDRLGNVTIKVPQINDTWKGIPETEYKAKKRVISKRAFALKALSSVVHSNVHLAPRLTISAEVLGKSEPPYAQMCTLGPTTWVKHFSPLIGRLAGTKVNRDENDDQKKAGFYSDKDSKRTQKYDFQANQIQLSGPVPSKMYHRYVAFRPIIGSMFADTGVRGKILNFALHKQHNRIYNFDRNTLYGSFEPCSEEASLQFLRMAHFDAGGRIFTYVLSLDGLLRFTETGTEFGIDMLSKHTMHSDVQTYIACSGEFFVRRLQHPDASEDPEPNEKTHPDQPLSGGPPNEAPPTNPSFYQLTIDNDSGTYRPDKSILPLLKEFLQKNFPGLGIVAMHWEDKELQKLKEKQRNIKKQEGKVVHMVQNRSQSSISSAESELNEREEGWDQGQKSKRETALGVIEDPRKLKEAVEDLLPHRDHDEAGSSSKGKQKVTSVE